MSERDGTSLADVISAWIDETVIVNDDGAWLDADELREIIKGAGDD